MAPLPGLTLPLPGPILPLIPFMQTPTYTTSSSSQATNLRLIAECTSHLPLSHPEQASTLQSHSSLKRSECNVPIYLPSSPTPCCLPATQLYTISNTLRNPQERSSFTIHTIYSHSRVNKAQTLQHNTIYIYSISTTHSPSQSRTNFASSIDRVASPPYIHTYILSQNDPEQFCPPEQLQMIRRVDIDTSEVGSFSFERYLWRVGRMSMAVM